MLTSLFSVRTLHSCRSAWRGTVFAHLLLFLDTSRRYNKSTGSCVFAAGQQDQDKTPALPRQATLLRSFLPFASSFVKHSRQEAGSHSHAKVQLNSLLSNCEMVWSVPETMVQLPFTPLSDALHSQM